MQFEITALYAAAMGLLTVGLGFATVITRAKTNISWADEGNLALQRAIRAHGNLIEYMPIFLIILLLLESMDVSAIWLHALGGSFLIGRLISVLYFWGAQKFAFRVIAFWGAIAPILIGSILLLTHL